MIVVSGQALKLLISLDYELFFGAETGTIENCLIRPIDGLIEVLDQYGGKLSLFVDSGFLWRMAEQADRFPELKANRDLIVSQLKALIADGHDVQLHIHPHWEDTVYNGSGWEFDTTRYRLHNFEADDIADIVLRYTQQLRGISDNPVFAYRAGGWCMQPFEALAPALHDAGIWLDSTVFDGGISSNSNREFNFIDAPKKAHWRFENDPVTSQDNGRFLELPITSISVSPVFFWKMLFAKLTGSGNLIPFGDGKALSNNSNYYWDRLTKRSLSPASIDGLKASLLEQGLETVRGQPDGSIYNVMGHPKALTPYSLKQLDKFLARHNDLEFITYQDLQSLKPGGPVT